MRLVGSGLSAILASLMADRQAGARSRDCDLVGEDQL